MVNVETIRIKARHYFGERSISCKKFETFLFRAYRSGKMIKDQEREGNG